MRENAKDLGLDQYEVRSLRGLVPACDVGDAGSSFPGRDLCADSPLLPNSWSFSASTASLEQSGSPPSACPPHLAFACIGPPRVGMPRGGVVGIKAGPVTTTPNVAGSSWPDPWFNALANVSLFPWEKRHHAPFFPGNSQGKCPVFPFSSKGGPSHGFDSPH